MKRLTKEEFVLKAKKIHGNEYDYSLFEYYDSKTEGKIICSKHGIFQQKPSNHMNGNGCYKCGTIKTAESKKSNKEEFVLKAKKIHGDRYDYSLFEYHGSKVKGKIICNIHGVFEQISNDHLGGSGCSKCMDIIYGNSLRSNKEQFISKAKEIHENKYDYSLFEYINCQTKGKIICVHHGIFEQISMSHLQGIGCPKCGLNKIRELKTSNKEEFVSKAKKIHGDRYNYSLFEYIGVHIKSKIICKNHGIFEQTPNNHLSGNGCPACTYKISKPEMRWLDSLNVPIRNHSIETIKKKIKVDGYDPATNTVYQFHGDYWHGNPSVFKLDDYNKKAKRSFRELYEKTLLTNKLIKDSGYNLIIMWEKDYK